MSDHLSTQMGFTHGPTVLTYVCTGADSFARDTSRRIETTFQPALLRVLYLRYSACGRFKGELRSNSPSVGTCYVYTRERNIGFEIMLDGLFNWGDNLL